MFAYSSITIHNLLVHIVWFITLYLGQFVHLGQSIDCFKCISINGSYKPCEDPFHNNYTTDIYESPCMGGRKGRDGLFPATSCVKITGSFDDNGHSIILRGCALDSGTLTTDTEIVRMSHCGGFYYDNRYVKGCVQSCNDAEACNSAKNNKNDIIPLLFTIHGAYLLFSII